MKPIAKLIGLSVIAGALAVVSAQAQCRGQCHGAESHGTGCWSASGQYGGGCGPQAVETVTGVVASVKKFTPVEGGASGVHLQLKTETETISVHLGPSWYLDDQEVQIRVNDRIEVTGFRKTFDGKPAIIAAEVKKGNGVLRLRDENGIPWWAGWRRR